MNRLLASLEKADRLSVDSLRRLYRTLAVQCHPDASTGSETEFVRLQLEYEEALRYLLSQQPKPTAARQKATNPREEFLRALYHYSVVYGTKNWHEYVAPLIKLAAAYDKGLAKLLAEYRDVFLKELTGGGHKTFLLQTHEMLLAAVKTLAWLYENDLEHDRKMLNSYLDALTQRAGGLKDRLGNVILGTCQFLQRESGGSPVSILTIGMMGSRSGRR